MSSRTISVLAGQDGVHQRRGHFRRAGVDLGAVRDKPAGHFQLPGRGRPVQQRPAAIVLELEQRGILLCQRLQPGQIARLNDGFKLLARNRGCVRGRGQEA